MILETALGIVLIIELIIAHIATIIHQRIKHG